MMKYLELEQKISFARAQEDHEFQFVTAFELMMQSETENQLLKIAILKREQEIAALKKLLKKLLNKDVA